MTVATIFCAVILLAAILYTRDQIMSKISEFSDRVNAAFGSIDQAVTGVSADVQSLKAEIEKLQNTPGDISPEDQAILDGIEAKVNDVAGKLTALDGLTTPPTPEA